MSKKPKTLGVTAVRLAMLEGGYLPIPVNGKRPLLNGWQNIIADPEIIRGWERERPNDRGTGSLTKIMPTIDADILDERGAEIIEALAREKFEKQGKLLRRVGLPPKAAFPFRVEEPFDKMFLRFWPPRTERPKESKDCQKIEILGNGQQVVVHGIHPDTGRLYEWSGGEPWTVALNELPLLTAAHATAFLADAKRVLAEASWGIWEDQEQEEKRVQDEGHWPLIMELAVKLWGEPTSHSGQDYRFGSKGSKAVNVYTNQWHDFEIDKGGGIYDLRKLLTNGGAAELKSSEVICSADIEMRAKHWLWEGHLLRGAVELLSGVPGLGKSQVQIGYIACATAGLPWPNGAPAIEPVNVIMVTAEDALDQEVIPRLIAAGANRERVFILKCIRADPKTKRQFLLAEDLDQLEDESNRIGNVGLITIDPLTAYMGGKMDSHKATEVRSQLGPLKDFAERSDVAISAITHPAKNAGHKAIDHFIGSQAFVAAARIGHVCVEEMQQDQDDEGKTKMVPTGRILFANPKNNADRRMATLAYKIAAVSVGQDPNTSETILAPRVSWDAETVDITADEAVAAVRGATKDQTKSNQQKEVQQFLNDVLRGKGPRPSQDVTDEALARGFTENQLRTARERLKIRSVKSAMAGGWNWELPHM
jgi:hypothetical protein